MLEGEAATNVQVPAREAYDAVARVDEYPAWQSLVDHVDVRERDAEGRAVLVATSMDADVRRLDLFLRYAYEPPSRVTFEQVRGDLKALRGAWTVEAAFDGLARVTYRVEVDPGFALGMLLRGAVADRVRAKVVDETLGDLRRQLERRS